MSTRCQDLCPRVGWLKHEVLTQCPGPIIIGTSIKEKRLDLFIARTILGMKTSTLIETNYYDCPLNPIHKIDQAAQYNMDK